MDVEPTTCPEHSYKTPRTEAARETKAVCTSAVDTSAAAAAAAAIDEVNEEIEVQPLTGVAAAAAAEVFATPDLRFAIFSALSAHSLAKAGEVCRQWHEQDGLDHRWRKFLLQRCKALRKVPDLVDHRAWLCRLANAQARPMELLPKEQWQPQPVELSDLTFLVELHYWRSSTDAHVRSSGRKKEVIFARELSPMEGINDDSTWAWSFSEARLAESMHLGSGRPILSVTAMASGRLCALLVNSEGAFVESVGELEADDESPWFPVRVGYVASFGTVLDGYQLSASVDYYNAPSDMDEEQEYVGATEVTIRLNLARPIEILGRLELHVPPIGEEAGAMVLSQAAWH